MAEDVQPLTEDAALSEKQMAVQCDALCDADGLVQQGVWCAKCFYDLRGQSRGGGCSECGWAVEKSLRCSVTFGDSKWAAKMNVAAIWVASGIITFLVGILIGFIMVAKLLAMTWSEAGVLFVLFVLLAFVLPWILITVGVFMFGARGRNGEGLEVEQAWILRGIALVLPACLFSVGVDVILFWFLMSIWGVLGALAAGYAMGDLCERLGLADKKRLHVTNGHVFAGIALLVLLAVLLIRSHVWMIGLVFVIHLLMGAIWLPFFWLCAMVEVRGATRAEFRQELFDKPKEDGGE